MQTPKIKRLFVDIETSPNIGFFWEAGFKKTIGYENIIKERAIICIGYKWEHETEAQELRQDISPERFYPLLDKNKTAFQNATAIDLETLLPPIAAGGGNEAIILKRLRAREFRNCAEFTSEDRNFSALIYRIISDGRVGKQTLRKVKIAFDSTADPVEMLAILRKEISAQYLLGGTRDSDRDNLRAPREVILSSYLL